MYKFKYVKQTVKSKYKVLSYYFAFPLELNKNDIENNLATTEYDLIHTLYNQETVIKGYDETEDFLYYSQKEVRVSWSYCTEEEWQANKGMAIRGISRHTKAGKHITCTKKE